MNIQAIGSAMHQLNCQPIRQNSAFKAAAPGFSSREADYGDFSACSDAGAAEQKFDLACRVAAYYRDKYEKEVRRQKQASKTGSSIDYAA